MDEEQAEHTSALDRAKEALGLGGSEEAPQEPGYGPVEDGTRCYQCGRETLDDNSPAVVDNVCQSCGTTQVVN